MLKICVYIVSFAICLYALDAVNYSLILKKNKVRKAQLLYFIIAMALAYLMGEFLLGLMIF